MEPTNIQSDEDSPQLEEQFTEKFKNLEKDILHIDSRMQHIQNFITNLEAQINNIKNLIKSDPNSGKKGNYYTIMNECLELNARYEQLYLQCMELKHRYRKEQDDLKYKTVRLIEHDMPKLKQDDKTALSPAKLSQLLNTLTNAIDKNDDTANSLTTSLHHLETDDEYSLK